MPDYIYHVTRRRDAEPIFRQGLLVDSDPPARKKQQELREQEKDTRGPMRDSPTVRAERDFDEIVRDAKREVEGTDKFPNHQPANFFWPTENQATQSAKSVRWGAVVVAVDVSKLPDHHQCAIAPTSGIDQLFKGYYDSYRGHGTLDTDKQWQLAREWWREVEEYDGQTYRRHEIWCDQNIPPEAINRIYDYRSGRTIYAPPDEADQRVLQEFTNGD